MPVGVPTLQVRALPRPFRAARLLGWVFLAVGLILTTLPLATPGAHAQANPVVSIDDLTVTDVNGTVVVTVNLATGPAAVTGLALSITYDPALIQPVLNTDVFAGTVGAPMCTQLNGASGGCGPIDPTDTVNISLFRTTGAWQGDVDLVELQFVAQGQSGVSPLTIELSDLADLSSVSIAGVTDSGSVTIGTGAPTSTATPLPSNADLSISKTAAVAGTLVPGSTVSYTLLGSNTGPDPAADVVVSDTLPAGLSFDTTPASPGWSCAVTGQSFSCTTATLASGQNFVFTYDVVVDATAVRGATLENEAVVSTSSTDPGTSNNSATAAVTIAPAAAATQVPDPTEPTATSTPETTEPTATSTPETTEPAPTSTPETTEPTPTPTPETTEPTPTPVVVGPTATSTPLPSVTMTPAAAPTATAQPIQPRLPTPEPALAYPGPFNNPPPSGARGDGFLVQPNATTTPVSQPATANANSNSAGTSAGADGTTTLAVTGSETPVLSSISLSLLALGGLLLVFSRREDQDT